MQENNPISHGSVLLWAKATGADLIRNFDTKYIINIIYFKERRKKEVEEGEA